MNRFAACLVIAALWGCSSSGPDIVRPEIELVQLYGPTDLVYTQGASSVMANFGFRISNRAAEPITLRRIELESSGEGGYYLRPEGKPFTRQIGPGEVAEETMQALALFRTTPSGAASNEPVMLRATFHFDSARGTFRKVLLRNIGQFSSGPR